MPSVSSRGGISTQTDVALVAIVLLVIGVVWAIYEIIETLPGLLNNTLSQTGQGLGNSIYNFISGIISGGSNTAGGS